MSTMPLTINFDNIIMVNADHSSTLRSQLLIGNRNYSSWSMRAGLIFREFSIPCEEVMLSFSDMQALHERTASYGAAKKVPLWLIENQAVWDTLAIYETFAERYPEANLWPRSHHLRAFARSMCAEIHNGFVHLRQNMPMNIEAQLAGIGWNLNVQQDIDRIESLWQRALQLSEGPYLLGAVSGADLYFTPICMRFITYAPRISTTSIEYIERVRNLKSVKAWVELALQEKEYIAMDEPYRSAPSKI